MTEVGLISAGAVILALVMGLVPPIGLPHPSCRDCEGTSPYSICPRDLSVNMARS